MIWVGLLFIGALCNGCVSKEEKKAVEAATDKDMFTSAQKALADLQTGKLEYRMLSSVVSCPGEIEVPPHGMASVTAPLGGYIEAMDMVPGRYVKKGQLLARLTNPEYIVLQQSYLETAGELKFAKQDFLRQKMLQQQNATAEKKMQESESTFSVLKARLAGLRAQLKLVGINLGSLESGSIQEVVILRAPIAGYVTEVNHHPGEFVEPREAIFEIVNMNDLHLHLNVFEQDIARVNKGQQVRFKATGDYDTFYTGVVSLVSPKRNTEGQSFDVHAHIEREGDMLKPGMYVQADILMSADTVPALPQGAVVYRNNEGFVVAERDGQFTIESVQTGVKMDGWVEVINFDALDSKNIVTHGASRIFAALMRE